MRKESVCSVVRMKTTISEKDTIDANANEVASVLLAYRKDIQCSRKIAMWTAPCILDMKQPHFEAASKASGLIPSRCEWRLIRL